MNTQKGFLGTLLMLLVVIALTAGVTYWYVRKDVTPIVPMTISTTSTPVTGSDTPYQPLYNPPVPITQVLYSTPNFSFKYPSNWQVEEVPDALYLSQEGFPYIFTITAKPTGFGSDFKECLSPKKVTIAGKEQQIRFLCPTQSPADTDVRVVLDTGLGVAIYGSMKADSPFVFEYLTVLRDVASTFTKVR
ncbi:MAG: hypothetical protein RJB39_37 [Candidatus Parcubacteria bacterium]|jgi:hypothetical protein